MGVSLGDHHEKIKPQCFKDSVKNYFDDSSQHKKNEMVV